MMLSRLGAASGIAGAIAPGEEITRLLGMLALLMTLWVIAVARWLGMQARV